jgi:hypothetical protein
VNAEECRAKARELREKASATNDSTTRTIFCCWLPNMIGLLKQLHTEKRDGEKPLPEKEGAPPPEGRGAPVGG